MEMGLGLVVGQIQTCIIYTSRFNKLHAHILSTTLLCWLRMNINVEIIWEKQEIGSELVASQIQTCISYMSTIS